MILLRPVKPHVAHIPLSTFRPVLFCVCVYVCLCVVTVLSSPSASCVYYVLTFSWLLYIKKVVITLIIDGKGEKGLFFFFLHSYFWATSVTLNHHNIAVFC